MSRIGKKPVAVPKGVTAKVEGQTVTAKGPKGELAVALVDQVTVVDDGRTAITVEPRDESKEARAHVGHVAHAGAEHRHGRDRRASRSSWRSAASATARRCRGKNLNLALGYSHDVDLSDPGRHSDSVTPKPTEIVVSGIDKQKVGQVAAEIRRYRPPEPYKGKGVKYAGEFIFRKEGKKK